MSLYLPLKYKQEPPHHSLWKLYMRLPFLERFHLRDQRSYWFNETKESIYIKITIAFNSQRDSMVNQSGQRFFVVVHQHGRRDVMWKRFICHNKRWMSDLWCTALSRQQELVWYLVYIMKIVCSKFQVGEWNEKLGLQMYKNKTPVWPSNNTKVPKDVPNILKGKTLKIATIKVRQQKYPAA